MPGTKLIMTTSYGAESREGQSDIRNKAQTALIKAQKTIVTNSYQAKSTEWQSSFVRFRLRVGLMSGIKVHRDHLLSGIHHRGTDTFTSIIRYGMGLKLGTKGTL